MRYTGRVAGTGAVFDATPEEGADVDLDAEAPGVAEGLLAALLKMKKGETAEVTVSAAHAFGDAGLAGPRGAVPPGAAVVYEAQLLSMENPKQARARLRCGLGGL